MPEVAVHYCLVEDCSDAAEKRLSSALITQMVDLTTSILIRIHSRVEWNLRAGKFGVRDACIARKVNAWNAIDGAVNGRLGVGRTLDGLFDYLIEAADHLRNLHDSQTVRNAARRDAALDVVLQRFGLLLLLLLDYVDVLPESRQASRVEFGV